MQSPLEELIATVNVALERGQWEQVVALTADLYACAIGVGDVSLADLVQDLHWIAQDAVAHPLEVVAWVSP